MDTNKKIEEQILEIKILLSTAKKNIESISDIETLEKIKSKFLGKKGLLTFQINSLKFLSIKQRPKVGTYVNFVKQKIKKKIIEKRKYIESKKIKKIILHDNLDISLPGRNNKNGAFHPITQTIRKIENFFVNLGFTIVFGKEIEDDIHNFDALNIEKNHPARTSNDTFWFDKTRLLRTQTSSVQIRVMKENKLPIRMITSGRVYRNDHDHTHTPMFHQLEGLFIDSNVNFLKLKSILIKFLYNFFKKDLKIRFRPSYFPFTEPSAEVDILYKKNHWLEVLGCGMVHPNVLNNVEIDSRCYSGFAFGMGIERLTMLRYDINDIRCFFENDVRFLKQFK